MSTKDITRFLHRPRKHYAGARLQQGRLLLDSDFNEAGLLRSEDRRLAALTLIGPRATPDQGFSIGVPMAIPATEPPGDPGPVVIPDQVQSLQPGSALPVVEVKLGGVLTPVRLVSVRTGSFYLGGSRLDLEKPEHIAFQRDFLQARAEDLTSIDPDVASPESPPTGFREFYYLHAWDQGVSPVEDEEIYEAGLGGEQTSTRVRRMRRIEVLRGLPHKLRTPRAAWRELVGQLRADNARFDARTGQLLSNGLLQLRFQADNPLAQRCGGCVSDAGARFLGSDNQALRIVLTSPSTFVWAGDNGAPIYRIKVRGLDADVPDAIEIEMLTPPADDAHWPLTNRVVEIIPFGALIQGGTPPGTPQPHFRKVAAELGVFSRVVVPFDPNNRTFSIDPAVNVQALKALIYQWDKRHPAYTELSQSTATERYFYLRVWHEAPSAAEVELPISQLGEFLPELGDTGVEPMFKAYGRRGDYWVAAVRPGAPEPITPFDLASRAVPPHGPRHFYSAIALVEGDAADLVRVHADARPQIRKLSDNGCVTFTVGDGVNSFGDYTSIQDAIDALPEGGGRVSVRPGLYRENVDLSGRSGIVLEGCGEASVMEAPLQIGLLSPNPLIRIEDAQDITLMGLSLRSIERSAVLLSASTRITLSGLSLLAGVRSAGLFVLGTANSSQALIDVRESCREITLSRLILEPVSRPAVRIVQSDYVGMSELTCVGSARSRFGPRRPMIAVSESGQVTIRDTIISSFGQVGVAIGALTETRTTSDVQLRGLSVVTGQHRSTRNGALTASRSGVRIDGGERISLEDSSIVMEASLSEHAAVVVKGKDISIRGNRFEALTRCFDRVAKSAEDCHDRRALAWGGLQLRGGCERVEVRANHVIAGVGHGITLGSLLWVFTPLPSSSTPQDLRSEGPGRGQLQSRSDGVRVVRGLISGSFRENGRRYVARNEGPLKDIVLADNRVEQMFTNGISVLSVLGMPGAELIDLENTRIERNTIVGNLLQPADSVPSRGELLPFDPARQGEGTLIAVLPFGGIVLGTATNGIEIRGNLIANNGVSGILPINGIFVLTGDAIVIADNRVVNNGGRATANLAPRPGVRAGIAVMLAGTGLLATEQALDQFVTSPSAPDIGGISLRVLNNTVLHPEGRALHAVVTGPVTIDGNSLASLGNHGSNSTSDLFAVGEIVFVMNMGPPWEDEPPIDFSAFATPPGTEDYLENSPSASSPTSPSEPRRLALGDGGGILFNNNQVTFDWALRRIPLLRLRAPISYFPVALLTLDHLALEGNQFSFRMRGLTANSQIRPPVRGYAAPVLSHVFLAGATLQVGGNRFAESVTKTLLSMLAIAELMNVSTYNQATHQIFVTTTKQLASPSALPTIPSPPAADVPSTDTSQFAHVGDQVMFSLNGINVGSKMDTLRSLSARFLELLLDRR